MTLCSENDIALSSMQFEWNVTRFITGRTRRRVIFNYRIDMEIHHMIVPQKRGVVASCFDDFSNFLTCGCSFGSWEMLTRATTDLVEKNLCFLGKSFKRDGKSESWKKKKIVHFDLWAFLFLRSCLSVVCENSIGATRNRYFFFEIWVAWILLGFQISGGWKMRKISEKNV